MLPVGPRILSRLRLGNANPDALPLHSVALFADMERKSLYNTRFMDFTEHTATRYYGQRYEEQRGDSPNVERGA